MTSIGWRPEGVSFRREGSWKRKEDRFRNFRFYTLYRLTRLIYWWFLPISSHNLRFWMKFLSRPCVCYFMALSSSRLRTLFAHSIMSSSVITSSSRLDWTIFLLTIRPTSSWFFFVFLYIILVSLKMLFIERVHFSFLFRGWEISLGLNKLCN